MGAYEFDANDDFGDYNGIVAKRRQGPDEDDENGDVFYCEDLGR